MDREIIVKKHKKEHDRLTKLYYKDKALSKEEFDQLHGQNWDDMDAALVALEEAG